jgi:hypothetical protein
LKEKLMPDLDLQIIFPDTITVNMMPPVPDKLYVRNTATAILKNNSTQSELLFAKILATSTTGT